MDMGWNSDIDSSLLSCWNETETDSNTKVCNENENIRSVSDDVKLSTNFQSRKSTQKCAKDDGQTSWDGDVDPSSLARLPSFSMYYENVSEDSKSSNSQKPSHCAKTSESLERRESENKNSCSVILAAEEESEVGLRENASQAQHPGRSATSIDCTVAQSLPEGSVLKSTIYSTYTDSSHPSPLRHHGISLPSGAFFGDNRVFERSNNVSNAPRLHPLAIQSSANCPHRGAIHSLAPRPASGGIHRQAVLPLIGHTGVALNSTVAAGLASIQHQVTKQQQQNVPQFVAAAVSAHSRHFDSGAPFSFATGEQSKTTVGNQPHRSKTAIENVASKSLPPSSSSQEMRAPHQLRQAPPPFYLFDAPIELRANFMQSQRKLGIPVINDCNSYHYGEMVKGFHPQLIHDDKVRSIKGLDAHPSLVPVQLIDARHGSRPGRAGRVKNEREQKRAQKITELIEQLRVNMEIGGWKVEMRSKFHTLSSCADYVKHLVKTMKEKEEIVRKLKADLGVKQREIEVDKELQESRSDPESVTSSLTSSTVGSGSASSAPNRGNTDADSRGAANLVTSFNKPPPSSLENVSDSQDAVWRSRKLTSPLSSTDFGSSNVANDNFSRGCAGNFSSERIVSDPETSPLFGEESSRPHESSRSIPSVAVLSNPEGNNDCLGGGRFTNIVCTRGANRASKKRPPGEATSLEGSFELDYEEVFAKSNIPQLIATTSGKIVTWNRCFLSATGLKKEDAEKMTIFSLVKPENLSIFFEIVAAALRRHDDKGRMHASDRAKTCKADSSLMGCVDIENVESRLDCAALPCIDFPTRKRRSCGSHNVDHSDPLFVTVTLMADKDHRKRYFHCIFTDCPGTKEVLGSFTPDVSALLFKTPGNRDASQKRQRIRQIPVKGVTLGMK